MNKAGSFLLLRSIRCCHNVTDGNNNSQAPICERGVVNYDEPLITGTVKAGVVSGHLASAHH